MPGPLPNPQRRRRNAPTIPTTHLPAAGRQGPAPTPPAWVELGPMAGAWWEWAWTTPQAAGWSDGDHVAIARRARLEDLQAADPNNRALMQEARELDDRFGLTPKGRQALRWTIVADAAEQAAVPAGVPKLDDRRRRLTGTDA